MHRFYRVFKVGTSTRGGHLATELLNVELGLKLKQAAPGQENSAILAQSKSSPVSFLSYFKLYTPPLQVQFREIGKSCHRATNFLGLTTWEPFQIGSSNQRNNRVGRLAQKLTERLRRKKLLVGEELRF